MAWTAAGKNAWEYRDPQGVLWRAEKTMSGMWQLTADGQDEGLYTEMGEALRRGDKLTW